jgi:hypothetical protein
MNSTKGELVLKEPRVAAKKFKVAGQSLMEVLNCGFNCYFSVTTTLGL